MKFEFTGETKVVLGITLKQIRALVSLGAVAKGEIGGWIEKEGNLSQLCGDAWVSGNARVCGNAWVSGNAQVSGNADFFLLGPIGSRRDHLCIHADTKIGVRFTTGCFSGTEYHFKAAIQKTHGDSEIGRQYSAALNLALMMVRPAKVENEEAA